MNVSRRLVLLMAACAVLAMAGKKSKGIRAPSVEVVEISAHRTAEDTIEVDGRVRNCGDRTLRDLSLGFQLLASGGEVVTTQRGSVEDGPLQPGDEAEFHCQMQDPARAVKYLVTARDREIDLEVSKAGPYPIE